MPCPYTISGYVTGRAASWLAFVLSPTWRRRRVITGWFHRELAQLRVVATLSSRRVDISALRRYTQHDSDVIHAVFAAIL